MDLIAPGLENALLRLEPLREAHREPLRDSDAVNHMWDSMPAIQRGAGFDTYFDFMLRCDKDGDTLPFVMIDAKTDRLAGVTAFVQISKVHRRLMIGLIWIDPGMRGKGLFRASQALMIKRALAWGARRVGWNIEGRNEKARSAILALGAVQEGILRSYSRYADGTWVDIVLLSMLRDEAKAALQRLEAELTAPLA